MRLTDAQREQLEIEIEQRWDTIAEYMASARAERDLIRTLNACLKQDEMFTVRLAANEQPRGEQCAGLHLIRGSVKQSL